MSIFDVAEGRDAAMVHLAPSLTESADAERWTEKIHNRAVLERALAVHVNSGKGRDFESALWIKETWDYPHATAEQIARLRNRSVGDIQHILHDDNEAIIPIAKYLVDSGAAEREWTDLTNGVSMPGNCPASLRPTAARLWKTFRSKPNTIPVEGKNCSPCHRNRVHLQTGMLFGLTTEWCSASDRNRVHLRPDSPPHLRIGTSFCKK